MVSNESLIAVYDETIEVEEHINIDQIKQALEMLTGIKKTILKLFLFEVMTMKRFQKYWLFLLALQERIYIGAKKELLDQLKGVVHERY